MNGHECAMCEHWCEQGIKFKRNGYIIFRCSTCKHETTMIQVPKDLADSYE